MNRVEFQELAEVRFMEARSLLDTGFSDGAYYLAGYAVECALKACIAKRTQEHDFPDKKLVNESHTHNLIELMRISNLTALLKVAMQNDPILEDHWTTVQSWSETSRYQRYESWQSQALIDAIANPIGGLLPWIRQHW